MTTGLNSRGFSSCSRMRKAGGRSTHDPTDVALLNMTVDSQSLFRRKVSGISLSTEKVLAIEAAGRSEPTIKTRLSERLKSISAEQSRYEVSLSLGVARFDPRNVTSIGKLMAKADRAMYEQKRRRSMPVLETEPSLQSQYNINTIGDMGSIESSSLNFLPAPATLWHRPARCNLTEPGSEGYLTNACTLRKT